MKSVYPLISCICITNNRIALLKHAIECFINQDYPNKEFVVSYPENDKLTNHIIENNIKNNTLNILKIERPYKESLGEARNQAIKEAHGDYICIWDDDDWYHPNRLSYQFNSMQIPGKDYHASILNRLILYDQTTQKAYLSFLYDWEGTLLCKKELFLENHYACKDVGEDSNVIDSLNGKRLIYHISKAPFLYIYIYHRSNTWNYSHFKSFFKRSELLNPEITLNLSQLIS